MNVQGALLGTVVSTFFDGIVVKAFPSKRPIQSITVTGTTGVDSTQCVQDSHWTESTRSIVKAYLHSAWETDRNENDRTFSTRRMKYPGLIIHRQRDTAG